MSGRGRESICRDAAAAWLAKRHWFTRWPSGTISYHRNRLQWKQIADAVRDAGFYSPNTGTIDVPVERIVMDAIEIRDNAASDPREKGDDDGVEYADPRDYRDGLE